MKAHSYLGVIRHLALPLTFCGLALFVLTGAGHEVSAMKQQVSGPAPLSGAVSSDSPGISGMSGSQGFIEGGSPASPDPRPALDRIPNGPSQVALFALG